MQVDSPTIAPATTSTLSEAVHQPPLAPGVVDSPSIDETFPDGNCSEQAYSGYLNKFDVLSFYLSNGGLLSWKEVIDWANSNGFGKYPS